MKTKPSKNRSEPVGEKPPLFSVIIATYRRPSQRLTECLQALASQTCPGDRYEIIIVDDGSPISSRNLVEPFRGDLTLKFPAQSRAGPAAARNNGANQAEGKYLAFTDDDCAPAPDWLERLAERFALYPECVIGGRTLNGLPENPYSAASQLLLDYIYEYCNPDPQSANFFAGDNFALPAHIFSRINGFNTSFFMGGEDRELCYRLLEKGVRLVYAPEVLVYHRHQLNFLSFVRQHFNYGCGAYYYQQSIRKRAQRDVRPEPMSFYKNMLKYPLSRQSGRRAVFVSLLIGVSQAAYVFGFLSKFRHGWTRIDTDAGSSTL